MYISPVYHPTNPASITTHEVVRGLVEKGNNIDLLVSSRCMSECSRCSFHCNRIKGVSVRRISVLTSTAIDRYLGMRLLLFTVSFLPLILYALAVSRRRKHEVVMVMYHAIHLAPLSAFLVSRFLRVPLVMKIHDAVSTEARWGLWDMGFRILLSRLNAVALRQANKILALSDELALLVKRIYGVKQERLAILPNSVDTRLFTCNPEYESLKEQLGLKGRKVIMHIGSLVTSYRKNGIKLLIQTLPLVLSWEERLAVLLVGKVPDQFIRELRSLASALHIGKHLMFMGQVPYEEMPRYISIADVCVGPLCPSLDTYGSVPRKVLEYMACAKPVVSCKGCVASDLIVNGYNGLLMQHTGVEELASCIGKLVIDEKVAKTMGANGRSRAKTSYDRQVLANRLDKEIRELVMSYSKMRS